MKNLNFEIRGNFLQKKITEHFIFYKPKFDYKEVYAKKEQIIFIPKEVNNSSPNNYIPCMFYKNNNSKNVLICFHGNSEDIFTIDTFGLDFRSYLNMNVLFVEYPGYSIYMDKQQESKKIFSDTIIVYDWVKEKFNITDDQIFIYGRSLGTSPAIYLSSIKKPNCLFLVSAFTSMKDIGADKFVSPLLEEIFNSIKYIKYVKCPILFIHGENDSLINYQQSQNLLNEVLKYGGDKRSILVKRSNMSHNNYDIKEDIINQMDDFLKKNNLILNKNFIINFDFIDSMQIPNSIERILESKIFNIKEFYILNNKDIKKKNANILIRLLDERIALSNGSKITIYNDKNYKEDYTIELYEQMNNMGEVNCLCQLKNNNLVCSTTSGQIFKFEIYEGDYDNKIYKSLNEIIYKIDVFDSNKIILLSENYIKIYDDKLNEIQSIKHSKEYINFLQFDHRFAFLTSNNLLKFCIVDENGISLLHYIKFEGKVHTYCMAKGYKSLILAYNNIIEYINLNHDHEISDNDRKGLMLNENITCIHRIHDELFLASTDKGSIIQIIITENNNIEKIQNKFVNGEIKFVLFKNMKTILFTHDNKINVLINIKKNSKFDDCLLI